MSAIILDGKSLALETEQQLQQVATQLIAKTGGRTPTLATILVGDDPSSATYVQMKVNACKRVGIGSKSIKMGNDTTTAQLLQEIEQLNNDEDVHGILLQHPVPQQIDERACFDAISISKDVDGVTTSGFGLMAMG